MPPSKLDMEQSSWNALSAKLSMSKAKDSTIPYYHGMVLKTACLQPCLLPLHVAFTLHVPYHFAFTLPVPHHFAFTLPVPYHFTF